jgi:hypothetical protein
MLKIDDLIGPSDAQWQFVIREMRNSWGSKAASDTYIWPFELGQADAKLCAKLCAAGPDHAKYLRQLPIHVAVTAPSYWWREFDTYRIGVEAGDVTQNSSSQMHTLGREPFSTDMFSFEDMDTETAYAIVANLNTLRQRWIDRGKRKGPQASEWRAMLQAIPDSWNYRRGVSMNYGNARAMVQARRNHRLSEWRQFCEALLGLPYSWMLTEE